MYYNIKTTNCQICSSILRICSFNLRICSFNISLEPMWWSFERGRKRLKNLKKQAVSLRSAFGGWRTPPRTPLSAAFSNCLRPQLWASAKNAALYIAIFEIFSTKDIVHGKFLSFNEKTLCRADSGVKLLRNKVKQKRFSITPSDWESIVHVLKFKFSNDLTRYFF